MKQGLLSTAALALLTLGVSGAASAQSARQWTVKLGVGQVSPQVHSGEVSAPALPHTKADVSDDARPVLALGYGVTDHLAVSLDVGQPFRLDLTGAGAIAGTGTLGTMRAIAPTAFLQVRPSAPTALLRPYVGIGLTYARFSDEKGSGQLTAITNTGGAPVTFELDRRWAPSLQAGLTVNVNQRWFADFMVAKTRLRTVGHFSTGQTLQMRLDPNFTSVAFGYRF
jgi:outer membrane protein